MAGAPSPSVVTRGLPDRYAERWRAPFEERLSSELRPGVRILDVGSGRRPTLPIDERPSGCFYAGLDISESEMLRAPAGSYDEYYVSDVTKRVEAFKGQFDVVISWQVLEHVKPLEDAFENIHYYLKPGGRMITQFSGTFSIFGLINQVVPSSLTPWALKHLTKRDPETVFPAYYHHCWASAIKRALKDWSDVEVIGRYNAASYWRFAKPLQKVYLQYEDWALRTGRDNLATHYLVDARKRALSADFRQPGELPVNRMPTSLPSTCDRQLTRSAGNRPRDLHGA